MWVKTNLQGAILRRVNLWDADLREAELQNTDLFLAVLRGAELHDAPTPQGQFEAGNTRNSGILRGRVAIKRIFRELSCWRPSWMGLKWDGLYG